MNRFDRLLGVLILTALAGILFSQGESIVKAADALFGSRYSPTGRLIATSIIIGAIAWLFSALKRPPQE